RFLITPAPFTSRSIAPGICGARSRSAARLPYISRASSPDWRSSSGRYVASGARMSTPEDPFAGSDVTILRPRPGRRGASPRDALAGAPLSPSSPQQSAGLLQPSAARSSSGSGDVPASGQNPLLQAAVPLLVLAGRLRGQVAHTDIENLRAQTVNE